jgi:Ca2+-binding RTX toxin-like protein
MSTALTCESRSWLRAPTSARSNRRGDERASATRPARRAAGISFVAVVVIGTGLNGGTPGATGTMSAAGAAERTKCGGVAVDIVGAEGDDRLRGNGLKNGLLGLGGDDRLVGAQNRDGLCAGRGKDVLSGGRGRDKLVGGAGADVLKGGLAADVLIGGPGDDTCIGGSGPGDDRLRRC